jgi:hypothetical protein
MCPAIIGCACPNRRHAVVIEAEVETKWGKKPQDGERENVEVDIGCSLVDVFRQR